MGGQRDVKKEERGDKGGKGGEKDSDGERKNQVDNRRPCHVREKREAGITHMDIHGHTV